MPVRRWNAGPADQAALYDGRLAIDPIRTDDVGRMLGRAAWRIAPKRLAKRVLWGGQCARIRWRARRGRFGGAAGVRAD